MEDNARLNYWESQWQEGADPPWQKKDVHEDLMKYGLPLLEGGPKRCFIPLCGKTLDLKFLYDEGHIVVGVEGVERAVRDFFEENNIQYTVKETPIKLYETSDERLRIYASDIFMIDHDVLGTFDLIWDRGALVSVYLEDRSKYARLIKNIAKTKCQYLVETIFYDGLEAPLTGGSPRCVTEKQFEEFFGDAFTITHFHFEEAGAPLPQMLGLDRVWGRSSILTRK